MMVVVSLAELEECHEKLFDRIKAELSKVAQQNEPQQHFTREEAAKYLRMSLATLDRLTARGEITRCKIGDGPRGTVLYRRVDLDAFVQTCLEMDEAAARKTAKRMRPK